MRRLAYFVPFAVLAGLMGYSGFKVSQLLSLAGSGSIGLSALITFLLITMMMLGHIIPRFQFRQHKSQPNPLGDVAPWSTEWIVMSSLILGGIWTSYLLISAPLDIMIWMGRFAWNLIGGFAMNTAQAGDSAYEAGFWNGFMIELADGKGSITISAASAINFFVFVGATGAGIWGLRTTKTGPIVKTHRIVADQRLKGFRIVQLSDIHIGPTLKKDFVEKLVAQVNSLRPDLIVVTGDIADALPHQVYNDFEPFRELRSTHGVYFVTGNHEYYSDGMAWIERVSELGWKPLLNESAIISLGKGDSLENGVSRGEGPTLSITGVCDPSGRVFVPEHRVEWSHIHKPESDFGIFLSHRPSHIEKVKDKGFHLMLSGHTHAGQFYPFRFLVRLAHRYFDGIYRFEQLTLNVSAGTGYWGPPNRFGVPGEITLLELTAPK